MDVRAVLTLHLEAPGAEVRYRVAAQSAERADRRLKRLLDEAEWPPGKTLTSPEAAALPGAMREPIQDIVPLLNSQVATRGARTPPRGLRRKHAASMARSVRSVSRAKAASRSRKSRGRVHVTNGCAADYTITFLVALYVTLTITNGKVVIVRVCAPGVVRSLA